MNSTLIHIIFVKNNNLDFYEKLSKLSLFVKNNLVKISCITIEFIVDQEFHYLFLILYPNLFIYLIIL